MDHVRVWKRSCHTTYDPLSNLLFLYVELTRTMTKAKYQAAVKLVATSKPVVDSVVTLASNATANGYVTQNEIALMLTSIDSTLTKLRASHKLLSELEITTSIPLCGKCK